MKFKKFISTVMALALIGTSIIVPSASAATIQLGDSNQDGGVALIDAYWIQMYLKGAVTATPQQITAMDANQDSVIDNSDVTTIMYTLANAKSLGTTDNLYTVPHNSTEKYRKHDYNSTDLTQHTTYTIDAAKYTPSNYAPYAVTTPDVYDNENANSVKIYAHMGEYDVMGSGFVIDDHLIATAANCVFDNENDAFLSDMGIEVWNEDCNVKLVDTKVLYAHVPERYVNPIDLYDTVNYDYALLYVEEDLSEYKSNLGVMTDEFMSTGSILTVSGFTTHNKRNRRYYSSGPVDIVDFDPSEIPHRYHAKAISIPGKSGGMVYFKSLYPYRYQDNNGKWIESNNELKSVVGINTHSGADKYSFGCRITTSLLRFYFQNDYLC
ncbi:MAG: trypsin-like peptidase domain-containing protein [Ruminococcus flavefaciens]|nr:trypsin-like peptidase domain-containing protein [Ruminococcus flavefaciens]